MQRVECYLPCAIEFGNQSLPSWRQNSAGEHFPGASATGLRCRTLAKHSCLAEPFEMDLPERDPQNVEAGWIGLRWDLLEADSCRCWRLRLWIWELYRL